MVSLSGKVDVLRTLGQKVPLGKLSRVQPIVLLQMVVGLSQVVGGGAAQPEEIARALILDGQQRLRALRRAAPHLDLSPARLLRSICSDESSKKRKGSAEDRAVEAVLEMCIGFLLRWLSRDDTSTYAGASSSSDGRPSLAHTRKSNHPFSLHLPFRARSCLTS
jgi:hypothetical protein